MIRINLTDVYRDNIKQTIVKSVIKHNLCIPECIRIEEDMISFCDRYETCEECEEDIFNNFAIKDILGHIQRELKYI